MQPIQRSVLRREFLALLLASAGADVAMAKQCVPVVVASAAMTPLYWAGQGQMRFVGLRIYDAHLWVGEGFDAAAFERTPLVLQLTYHRAFQGSAIAARSVQEIRRQGSWDEATLQQWQTQLMQWLPDVQVDDRLTGLYLPGQGMRLWLGEQALGVLASPELAQHFFGIWLSPETSEPALRRALLGPWAKGAL